MLAQLGFNSVSRLLGQNEMYLDGNAVSIMLTPPTPHSVTIPVNTTSGFHPIGGTPPVAQVTQSAQVFLMQALNILESQRNAGSIVLKLFCYRPRYDWA